MENYTLWQECWGKENVFTRYHFGLLRILEMAKEVGLNLGIPHSAPLGNGLFEFRTKGKGGIARSVFVNVINREIAILHTLIKKSDAIPKKDMKIIMQRAKEIKWDQHLRTLKKKL